MSEAGYPLSINNEEFAANRHNTTLYTYLGELGMYDHVFIQTARDEEGELTGAYIFEHSANAALYEKLRKFIKGNSLPMILNRDRVPDCDQNAWRKYNMNDVEQGVPEEWL